MALWFCNAWFRLGVELDGCWRIGRRTETLSTPSQPCVFVHDQPSAEVLPSAEKLAGRVLKMSIYPLASVSSKTKIVPAQRPGQGVGRSEDRKRDRRQAQGEISKGL